MTTPKGCCGAAQLSVVWADDVAYALDELQRRDMPVLLDLSRGAAALQLAQEIRAHRASTLMFAVVDERRPDLTTEAVLAGMADVFARPLGGRRVASAIERELSYESRGPGRNGDSDGDDLYSQSPAMRDVITLIDEAAAKRAGVLIRGEDGTGRQVAARAIQSGRTGRTRRSSPSTARPTTPRSSTPLCSARRRGSQSYGDPGRAASRASAGKAACTTRLAGRSTCRTSPTRRRKFRPGSLACCAIAKRCSSRPASRSRSTSVRWPAWIPASTGRCRKAAFATICSGACR